MKVFLAGTSLLPAYGGPAVSVTRLAMALADNGAEVGLWAADQSAVTTPLLSPTSSVKRLTGSEDAALAAFGAADVLHDNGMWLPHNRRLAALAAKQGLPRIVSTRGMLEPWAMNHKKWKKAIAWRIYQRHDLMKANCLHVTAAAEAQHVLRLNLGVSVRMIPNGVDIPEVAAPLKNNAEARTALFLGRIYPVKGLPMLIEAWARVRPKGWRLQIAGPDEGGHRSEVENAVRAAGLEGVVSFVGPLGGQGKKNALLDADLFVLPTYSESFGMAIAEALAHGVPVLTTMGAPWPMLREHGCGWWVDTTVDGVDEGLRQATSCDRKTLQAMGARGRAWVSAEFRWEHIANEFLSAYQQVRNFHRPEDNREQIRAIDPPM